MQQSLSIYDKRFSHVGIVRKREGTISIIHAEGNSNPKKSIVKEEAFPIFFKNAKSAGIYRTNHLDGNLLSDIAIDYLGVPFDWDFDMCDENRLYCTELILVVLKRVDTNISLDTVWVNDINKNIIPIDAITRSETFSEIVYLEIVE